MRKLGIFAGILVALVAIIALAPSVMAQGPQGNGNSNDGTMPERGQQDGKQGGQDGQGMMGHPGMRGHTDMRGQTDMRGHPGMDFDQHMWGDEESPIQVVADALGLTAQEVMTEVRNGKSIETLAEEKGVALTKVIDDIMAPHTATLDTYVEKGYISDQDAAVATSMARVQTVHMLVQTRPTSATMPFSSTMQRGQRGDSMPMMETIANELDMTTDELITELQAGKTMAAVIEAHGGNVETIVDTLVAEQAERMQTMVDNGRLTQDEVDQRLETMREQMIERFNQTNEDMAQNGPRSGDFSGRGR